MRRGRWRHEAGQASVEYLGVVLLVLAVMLGLLLAVPPVRDALASRLRGAVCALTASCRTAPPRLAACVTDTTSDDRSLGLTLASVRVGERRSLLVERRSDGTVDVTVLDGADAGLLAGVGVQGKVALGRLAIGLGGDLEAAALLQVDHARTYSFGDAGEATAFLERVRKDRRALSGLVVQAPASGLVWRLLGRDRRRWLPRHEYVRAGVRGEAGAGGGAGRAGGIDLSAQFRGALGGRIDHRTGQLTLLYALDPRLAATLDVGPLSGSAVREQSRVVAVSLDRRRRPLELAVTTSGSIAHGGQLAGVAGLLRGSEVDEADLVGRRVEVRATLDLRDPENWAVTKAFLASRVPGPPSMARDVQRRAAAEDLRRRLADDAQVDVRAYRTTSSSKGVDAQLGLGVAAGGTYLVTGATGRLERARTRLAHGGPWLDRPDCLRPVRPIGAA